MKKRKSFEQWRLLVRYNDLHSRYHRRMANHAEESADYGLDAPGVVRNLVIGCAAGLVLWVLTITRIWSGVISIGPLAFQVGVMGLICACICGGMAIWMIWSSKVGKIREREKLLDFLTWT